MRTDLINGFICNNDLGANIMLTHPEIGLRGRLSIRDGSLAPTDVDFKGFLGF
jgi:hypothetical protein